MKGRYKNECKQKKQLSTHWEHSHAVTYQSASNRHKKGMILIMKKNDYIYNGSALYRISKIENNLVKVVPTSRKMTCSLASRTYHQSQLEDLGYKIRGDLL